MNRKNIRQRTEKDMKRFVQSVCACTQHFKNVNAKNIEEAHLPVNLKTLEAKKSLDLLDNPSLDQMTGNIIISDPLNDAIEIIERGFNQEFDQQRIPHERQIRTQLLKNTDQHSHVILQDTYDTSIVIGHYQKDEKGIYIFTPETKLSLPSIYRENTLDVFNNAIKQADMLLGNSNLKKAYFDKDSADNEANHTMRQLLSFTNRYKERRLGTVRPAAVFATTPE